MKKIILLLTVLMVSLPTMVLAETNYYCQDNTTLVQNREITYCEDGKCDDITINETKVCEYGCNNNKCGLSPFYRNIVVMIIVISILVFGYYITTKSREGYIWQT